MTLWTQLVNHKLSQSKTKLKIIEFHYFWHIHRDGNDEPRPHISISELLETFSIFRISYGCSKNQLQTLSNTVWHYKIIRKRSNWSYPILFLFDLLLCCFSNLVFLGWALLGEKVIGGASIYFWARKTFLLRGLRLYVEFRRYESGELNERHFSTQRSHWLSDRHREREQ